MTILYIVSGSAIGLFFLGWLMFKPPNLNLRVGNDWLDRNCPDFSRSRWQR